MRGSKRTWRQHWGRASWARPLAAGLAFSLLTALAFPPFGVWPAALLALVPLVWLAVSGRRGGGPAWRDGVMVTLGVTPLWLYEHQWVIDVSALGYVPMSIHAAAYTGAFAWIFARVVRRWPNAPLTVLLPMVWTGSEFARGEVLWSGYPWLLLAHPLIDQPLLASPAVLLGTYFVVLLMACVVGMAGDLIFVKPRRVGPAVVGGVVVAASLGAGWAARLDGPQAGPVVRFGVVQTNLSQDNKSEWKIAERVKDMAAFSALTREAAALNPRPDVIVWPETMFPGFGLDPESVQVQREAGLAFEMRVPGGAGETRTVAATAFVDALTSLQQELGIPMLVGAVATDNLRIGEDDDGLTVDADARYNSVFLIHHGQIDPERYDKIHLTPFGEVMPYISNWDWLERQMLAFGPEGMSFDLDAGTRRTVFEVPRRESPDRKIRMVTPICFEAVKAAACRKLVFQGGVRRADVLVNLTNDGWYGHWVPARQQHLQIARWRCLELGTPMVRAANTGISTSIDHRGVVLRSGVEGAPGTAGAKVAGVLAADVAMPLGRTPYAAIGEVVGWGTMGGTIVLGVMTSVRRRSVNRAGRAVDTSAPAS